MRVRIPLRQAKSINLEDLINDALRSSRQAESLILEHADPRSIAVNNDITVLARLRAELESQQEELAEDRLEVYMRYLGGLMELAKRNDLQSVGFPWINGMCHSRAVIRGMGIWFEIANVMFNIAALQTLRATQSSMTRESPHYLKSAAGTFKYLAETVIPKLRDPPPPELSISNLELLGSICQTLSLEPQFNSWALSLHYGRIASELSRAVFTNNDWQGYFETKAKAIAGAACLEVAKSLHRSRKNSDHVLAKAAVVKCLSLSANDDEESIVSDEAERLLKTPFNRRSKKCLRDLEDIEFDPSLYFGKDSDLVMPKIECFTVPYSGLFATLLPERLYYAAFVAREQISQQVDTSISGKVYEMNQKLREALVIYALPGGIESSMRPGSVPSSLARLVKDLGSRRILQTSKESPELIHCLYPVCEQLIKDIESVIDASRDKSQVTPIKRQFDSLVQSFDSINTFLSSHRDILQYFGNMSRLADDESIDNQLREYLDMPPARNSKHKQRSNPAFLDRVFELEKTLNARMTEYETHCSQIQEQVRSMDIIETIRSYANTVLNSPEDEEGYNRALMSTVEAELSKFTEELDYVNQCEKQVDSSIRAVKETWARFQKFNSRSILKEEDNKVKAVQAATLTIYRWYDIDHDLSSLKCSLEKLLKLGHIVNDKADDASSVVAKAKVPTLIQSPSQEQLDVCGKVPQTFAWQPGTNVEICIK